MAVYTKFLTPSMLAEVVAELDIAEPTERSTDAFNDLQYVFIDDPVSSLDDNHLIELAVDLVELIKSSKAELKFIISTHNPLFYNVLHNAMKDKKVQDISIKYLLRRFENGDYELKKSSDSPFSYHLQLKEEIENAIKNDTLSKYHFNFLRNILEKTSTFFGKNAWSELLPDTGEGSRKAYMSRIINISSHSKHSGDEVAAISDDDKRVLKFLMEYLNKVYMPEIKGHMQSSRNEDAKL